MVLSHDNLFFNFGSDPLGYAVAKKSSVLRKSGDLSHSCHLGAKRHFSSRVGDLVPSYLIDEKGEILKRLEDTSDDQMTAIIIHWVILMKGISFTQLTFRLVYHNKKRIHPNIFSIFISCVQFNCFIRYKYKTRTDTKIQEKS